MLALNLRCALEHEVIGQPRAVHAVVRTVTVALSGLGPSEAPLGMYLFLGPSGTGKTHLARCLAHRLHGDTRRLAVVDCAQMGGRHEWLALTRQLAPLFRVPADGATDGVCVMPPLSILLIERIDRARPEVVQALVAALETGYLMLPDGKSGSLRGCLVLLTSNLCAREIFDAGRQEIGFSPRSGDLEESEKARVYQLCASAAEKLWGADLLGHLDDLIVFHRLREGHLPFILRRLTSDLDRRIGRAGVSCELAPSAAEALLERSGRYLRHGAWPLVKAFRRFVVFPVADLLQDGGLASGGTIRVEAVSGERFRFDVSAGRPGSTDRLPLGQPRSVPVR